MAKYLLKRLFHGILCVIVVVMLIMIMIYSLLDRNLIFASDTVYNHQQNNQKITYKYQKWEDYGYLDYVSYSDYLYELTVSGEIDEETRQSAV
ncbi:MAG: ABC transporter permease, partial [Lachnospiraceae bacterium]|nr:ABC transporter permease [Lachnospiraceae bacterium]